MEVSWDTPPKNARGRVRGPFCVPAPGSTMHLDGRPEIPPAKGVGGVSRNCTELLTLVAQMAKARYPEIPPAKVQGAWHGTYSGSPGLSRPGSPPEGASGSDTCSEKDSLHPLELTAPQNCSKWELSRVLTQPSVAQQAARGSLSLGFIQWERQPQALELTASRPRVCWTRQPVRPREPLTRTHAPRRSASRSGAHLLQATGLLDGRGVRPGEPQCRERA